MNWINYLVRCLEALILISLFLLIYSSWNYEKLLEAIKDKAKLVMGILSSTMVIFGLPFLVVDYSAPLSLPVELAFGGVNMIGYKDQALYKDQGLISENLLSQRRMTLNLVVEDEPEWTSLALETAPKDLEIRITELISLEGKESKQLFYQETGRIGPGERISFHLDKGHLLEEASIDVDVVAQNVLESIYESFMLEAAIGTEQNKQLYKIPKDARIESAQILLSIIEDDEESAIIDGFAAKITGDALLDITGMATSEQVVLQEGQDGYSGTDDAYISESFNNRGAHQLLHIGPGTDDSGLIRFDLSSLSQDAEIESCELSLYGMRTLPVEEEILVQLYPILLDWSEGAGITGSEPLTEGVSYGYRKKEDEKLWNTPGMESTTGGYTFDASFDRSSTAIVEKIYPVGYAPMQYEWHDFDITAACQGWHSGAWENYGIYVNYYNGGDAFEFYTSEYSNKDLRPKLTITYSTSAPDGCGSCTDCNAKIQDAAPGDIIKLTKDITNDEMGSSCIDFENQEDVIFDCQGHTIRGVEGQNNGAAFLLPKFGAALDSITIKNCILENFKYGINCVGCTNCIFQDLEISEMDGFDIYDSGIYIAGGQNNMISNVIFADDKTAINMPGADYNSINNIQVSGTETGLRLSQATDNTIQDFYQQGGEFGIRFYQASSNHLSQIRISDTIYEAISILGGSDSNSLSGMELDGNLMGIRCGEGSGNSIDSSDFENNQEGGIELAEGCYNSQISGNIFHNEVGYGIRLSDTPDDCPQGNEIWNNRFNCTIPIASDISYHEIEMLVSREDIDCTGGPNIIGGECIGGNFWGDPAGEGLSQSCTDHEAPFEICDEALVLTVAGVDAVDWFPLTYGSAEPSNECDSCQDCTDKIAAASAGDTIRLTQDITGVDSRCIDFDGKDSITFDCQDHKIVGTDDYGSIGIALTDAEGGSNQNTIKNCEVSHLQAGIYLSGSDQNTITDSTSYSNLYYGLAMIESEHNTVSRFTTIDNNDAGLYILRSSNNIFEHTNSSYQDREGFLIESKDPSMPSDNNVITGSAIDDNSWNAVSYYGYCNENILKDSYMQGNGYKTLQFKEYNPDGVAPQDNLVYNNYFQNEINIGTGLSNFEAFNKLNAPLDCTRQNILGGDCIGGNYWANLESSGFSETCTDTQSPLGICDAYNNQSEDEQRHIDWLPLTGQSKAPVQGTCSDGTKNQGETDVDCGGSCSPCQLGLNCTINSDCLSGLCDIVCIEQIPGNCSDGIKNQDESDMDCGGVCEPCTLGLNCSVDEDCISGYCNKTTGVCQNMSMLPYAIGNCSDGIRNQDESDIDCGGTICSGCDINRSCLIDEDCAEGSCIDNSCERRTNETAVSFEHRYSFITLEEDVVYSSSEAVDNKIINIKPILEKELSQCDSTVCEVQLLFKSKNLVMDVKNISITYHMKTRPKIYLKGREVDDIEVEVLDALTQECGSSICNYSFSFDSDEDAEILVSNLEILYMSNITTADFSGQVQDYCDNYPCHIPVKVSSKKGGEISIRNIMIVDKDGRR